MDFLKEGIEEYALKHTSQESDLLQKLNRQTWSKVLQPRMLSGHLQGRLLSWISCLKQPKRILEIGTYTGYSAIALTEGLQEDGELITIDKNEELEDMARSFFEESGYSDRIQLLIGDALEIIPKLNLNFDLIFIDADKENYIRYYQLLIDQLNSGAIIIADNVLWSGKVLEPTKKGDIETQQLKAFNDLINEDPRVENLLLPIRDGLMLIRVK